MSAQELLTFYENTGPAMFEKQFLLKRWKALYKSDPLKHEFILKTGLSGEKREAWASPEASV